MKVRYTRTALAEIESIFDYIGRNNSIAATKVVEAIENTIARLAEFPHSAVQTALPDVRVALAQPFPYLIFHTVDGETLLIRNIRHAARRRLGETQ